MAFHLVDPDSNLSFSHDWSGYLGAGDTIASRQWSITPLNGTSPETPSLTDDTGSIVLVQGCMAGKVYHLTEHIVTSAGIEDDRTIILRCENT